MTRWALAALLVGVGAASPIAPWGAAAWAAQPSLQVVAEPPSLLVGQSGTLHVMIVVEGGGHIDLAGGRTPVVPTDDALALRYRGTSQRFSATGAKIVSVYSFQYAVDALAEGTFTVGPATVTLSDGSVLTSRPVTVEVRPRGVDDLGPSTTLKVDAGIQEASAWEGQTLLYMYRLVTSEPSVRAQWRLPPFDGFRQPQHGAPEERTYQVADGDLLITTVEGTVPLVATGAGTVEIRPALVSVEMFTGGSVGWRPRQEERRATEPDSVVVRRLPPPPPGFSGAVGEVRITAELERDRAAVGESVGVIVRVESDGTLEGFQLPAYTAAAMSVYDDVSSVTGRVSDGAYVGVAGFRKVLVPVEPGTHPLPPLEVVTFSPERGEYVTHRVELGVVTATPGREGAGEIESFGAEPVAGAPEAPVVLAEPWTWGADTTPRVGLVVPGLLALVSLPGVLVAAGRTAAAARRRWRERRDARQGPPSPFKGLRSLPADPVERLQAYDTALRQALANRQGVSLGALDRDAAVAAVPEPLQTDVRKLFDGLGRARYGGGGATAALDGVVRRVLADLEGA